MRNVGLLLVALSILCGATALWGLNHLSASRAETPSGGVAGATIVVAKRPIGFGEAITADAVRLQAWPAAAAPPGAFRDIAGVVGARRVAVTPIAANEPILPERVTGPGGRATLAAVLRPGMRAASLRVDDVLGVAGFVLPGDTVDVLVTRAEGGDRNQLRTDTLLRGVRVLAVDQMADAGRTKPTLAKAATVEVTPAQAEKLALAAQVGALALALRAADEPAGASLAHGVRTSDLQDSRPPMEARRRPAASRRPAPAGPSIEVWRGGETVRVAVAHGQGDS